MAWKANSRANVATAFLAVSRPENHVIRFPFWKHRKSAYPISRTYSDTAGSLSPQSTERPTCRSERGRTFRVKPSRPITLTLSPRQGRPPSMSRPIVRSAPIPVPDLDPTRFPLAPGVHQGFRTCGDRASHGAQHHCVDAERDDQDEAIEQDADAQRQEPQHRQCDDWQEEDQVTHRRFPFSGVLFGLLCPHARAHLRLSVSIIGSPEPGRRNHRSEAPHLL